MISQTRWQKLKIEAEELENCTTQKFFEVTINKFNICDNLGGTKMLYL
jgi:hypothetical protein